MRERTNLLSYPWPARMLGLLSGKEGTKRRVIFTSETCLALWTVSQWQLHWETGVRRLREKIPSENMVLFMKHSCLWRYFLFLIHEQMLSSPGGQFAIKKKHNYEFDLSDYKAFWLTTGCSQILCRAKCRLPFAALRKLGKRPCMTIRRKKTEGI